MHSLFSVAFFSLQNLYMCMPSLFTTNWVSTTYSTLMTSSPKGRVMDFSSLPLTVLIWACRRYLCVSLPLDLIQNSSPQSLVFFWQHVCFCFSSSDSLLEDKENKEHVWVFSNLPQPATPPHAPLQSQACYVKKNSPLHHFTTAIPTLKEIEEEGWKSVMLLKSKLQVKAELRNW